MRTGAGAWLVLMLLANALAVSVEGGADGAGPGAQERAASRAATLIHDVFELQNMSLDLNGSYELANDIDASGTASWNDGAGFAPVGNKTLCFNGTLDGKGYKITGLFINRPTSNFTGLFGHTGMNNTVKNLGVVDFNVTGNDCVGGLVGSNEYGTVKNSYSTGNVFGQIEVGGLVGCNYYGTVNNSYATGNVMGKMTGDGIKAVGGLIGTNSGTVANSFFTGYASAYIGVGGIAGSGALACVVDHCHVTGNVTGTRDVGGLVGECSNGAVNNSYVTGNVNGWGCVGGLVGSIIYGSISKSYFTGNVTATGSNGGSVGGLVGGIGNVPGHAGTVTNSYSTGNVTVTGSNMRYVGGLAGYSAGSVINSYAAGYVSGTDSVGGLAGKNEGTVSDCFWDNETSGQNTSDGGSRRTTAQMKTKSTFTNAGWDFVDIWCIVEKITYPVFRWQNISFPIADAGVDQTVDEDTVVTFEGRGSTDRLGIANYTWTFRDVDPRTLYGVGPQYKFNDPGIFNVTLEITNVVGERNSDAMTVTVKDITPPVSNAGADQTVYKGTSVTFNGTGSSDNVGIVNYAWTFTDGSPVTLRGARPAYQFDNPGMFVVKLNVTDARGNWGTDTMTVTAIELPAPCADAGPYMVIDEGTVLTFNGNGSRGDIGIVNYTWTFTDKGPITLCGVQASYRFDNPGTFVVTLVITDAAGSTGKDTMNVTVNAVTLTDIIPPSAVAGPDQTVNEGTLVIFDGCGSSDDIGIVSYTWTFTDGAHIMLYGARQVYQFNNPGIFVATLNVTDAAGNRGTDTMTVTVKDTRAPFANAGRDRTVDEKTMVVFNGSKSSDNVGIVNYTWTFDYCAKSIVLSGVTSRFFFDVPGVYSVYLNVSDAAGYRSQDTMVVTVNDITPPDAVAGRAQKVRVGSIVVLDGSLSTDNCGIEKYFWNFTYDGNAQSLEGKNTAFRFDKAGIYEVVLTVVDRAGNWGEDRVVVSVVPRVNVYDGGPRAIWWVPVLLIAIAVAGIAGYQVMRRKEAGKDGT